MSTEDAERLANLAIESFQLNSAGSSTAKISDGYSSGSCLTVASFVWHKHQYASLCHENFPHHDLTALHGCRHYDFHRYELL
jgi:hypothetical protein